ncbi:MAG: superoxide dismutase [Phycisphaerae bacterium]|nr:superoxide dismutase [Phycisphaerae bacterium]
MFKPTIDRRSFLATAAALAAAPAASGLAQSTPPAKPAERGEAENDGPFTLAPLPYPADALEPAIDAATMRLHHGKHHAAYVKNLNAALKGVTLSPGASSIESLIAKIDSLPADKHNAVRNNGGGHANHTLFWSVLGPAGTGGQPSDELRRAIERDFPAASGGAAGMERLKADMTAAAMARFGSGWAWLVVTDEQRLGVTSTPNQDSPLMGSDHDAAAGTPIFGIDVWEHAYYLKYQNLRADYLKAIWTIVNWSEVSARFKAALADASPNG